MQFEALLVSPGFYYKLEAIKQSIRKSNGMKFVILITSLVAPRNTCPSSVINCFENEMLEVKKRKRHFPLQLPLVEKSKAHGKNDTHSSIPVLVFRSFADSLVKSTLSSTQI